MKGISRLLLVVSAVLLTISIFVPLWSIDLAAPQYPEGLQMLIYPDGVKGNVDIINGLNHYIGMKTIHNNDFIEFTILPYLIAFFAALTLLVALLKKRFLLYVLLVLFVLFGIIAMYDFWRWEYDYGHNLDPNAAIIVPGMAYQPPLIGFKQLLNFGAYSFPAVGGWLFIGSGVLMTLALWIDIKRIKHSTMNITKVVLLLIMFSLNSCTNTLPEKITLHIDHCDYCKMTISSGKFGSEVKTKKGRCYKFDDLGCMIDFIKENADKSEGSCYVHNFNKMNFLMNLNDAVLVHSDELVSPMKGNIAAFESKQEADQFLIAHKGEITTWQDLSK